MKKICIIIPCYNESQRLEVSKFRDFVRHDERFDFCFVNDGSKDNTSEVLRRAVASEPERFLLVDNADNRGKAEAVRSGMLYAASLGRYMAIGFLDADLATPLEDLHLLSEEMEYKQALLFVHTVDIGVHCWFPCCISFPCMTANAGRNYLKASWYP